MRFGWNDVQYHAACSEASEAVVQMLLQAYPEAGSCKDDYGRQPLHVAAGNNAPEAVIHNMLQACPEAHTRNLVNE